MLLICLVCKSELVIALPEEIHAWTSQLDEMCGWMDVTICAGMVSYAVKFGTGIGYVIMLSIMSIGCVSDMWPPRIGW
jgi:hypothetical protein